MTPKKAAASRRDFLRTAAGLAAAAGALPATTAAAEPAETLPTIALGPHRVTRLIIGGNPIYGYSHFNKHFDKHLTEWHTPDRVMELLKACAASGIDTFQNSYAERTLADVDRYRAEGGRMQWLCLGKPDWDKHPEHVDDAAKHGPIGIAPHGSLGERLRRQKKTGVLVDLLKRIRDRGVLVGLSAHDPALIAESEERGWDVDYYMCSLYYLTRPREETRALVGELPLGEVYLASDPPRMFGVIRATKKPCLAYKVLAAGRRVATPAEVRRGFAEAFAGIKPTDAVIVGMYQQFSNQVAEDAAIVRELGAPGRS
ncbi:MAG TPA: twin-arginine translocation signal domain-containing protein [Isosphaeraceae bacterium]|jgi:hypothetical protein|nr:twin-arginine translocation signal domain-containing protein [Isosphaeraceae bacterium]